MSDLRFATREALNLYTKMKVHRHQLQQGEKAYIKDIPYIWDGEQWCEYKAPKIEMSLYDLNEQIVRQLPGLTNEEVHSVEKEITEWDKKVKSQYYMLLCKEESYFTILTTNLDLFEPVNCRNLGEAVVSCCYNIGDLKAASLLEDNTFELWVYQSATDKMWCLHLFDYAQGVITFGYDK